MRCLGCGKTHLLSSKGMTWKEFQLCGKCYCVKFKKRLSRGKYIDSNM